MSKADGYGWLGRTRLWLTVAATLVVLAFTPAVEAFFGYSIDLDSPYLIAGLGLVPFALAFSRFLAGSLREWRRLRPGQHTLAALGLLVSVAAGVWADFFDNNRDYWWQVGVASSVLLLCDWLLSSTRGRAFSALPNLNNLLPEFSDVIEGREINRVAVSELRVGDIVLVRPGSVIPGDGVVVQGEGSVDEEAITGESLEVAKTQGSRVFAGSVNSSAKKSNRALTIRIDALGSDLLVSGITRRVQELAFAPVKGESRAVMWASIGFYFLLAVGLFGAGLWLVLEPGQIVLALSCLATVLVGSNVSALSYTLPLVKSLTATVAAQNGILLREDRALYLARKSHVVVFSLAGTLTVGDPRLVAIHLPRNSSIGTRDEVLALAAAAEERSDHPLAGAIRSEAAARDLTLPELHTIEPHPVGVSARFEFSEVLVGGPALLTQHNVPIDVADLMAVTAANERGNTIVYVVVDSLLVGYIEFADEVRQTAREVIRTLQLQRKRVVLLTGEATGVAEGVAKLVGITEVFAEVRQDRKVDIIDQLKADGSIITVVGDAFDDAATLALADVGVALGVGGEIAEQSASVAVIPAEPRAVGKLITLAKRSVRITTQNVVSSTVYNVASLGVSGFLFSPALGSASLLLSTIYTTANVLRMRKRP